MTEIELLKKKYEISKFAYETALVAEEKRIANEILDIQLTRKEWSEIMTWYKRHCETECIKPPDWMVRITNKL